MNLVVVTMLANANTLDGSRTHKIWFLRPARIPVPSQGRRTSELTNVLTGIAISHENGRT
jgi:hypothetical protein